MANIFNIDIEGYFYYICKNKIKKNCFKAFPVRSHLYKDIKILQDSKQF